MSLFIKDLLKKPPVESGGLILDDFDRLIVKNKTLTGSGNYKSLKVNFKGFTLKKEEEMYSIIIPVK